VDAHLGLAEILLARGEFGPGWIAYLDYQAGLAGVAGRNGRENWPRMPAPMWNGMRLPGKRILLLGDQGYGDMLQFVRYVPMVAARCGEVVLICDPTLAPLVAAVPGLASCVHRWEDVPPHTVHCRLSSLPGVFGTDLANMPAGVPYLHADPVRQGWWRARLDDLLGPTALRVGLVWAGRPSHANDRRRSLRLEQLAPLTAVPGARFVSLQPKPGALDAITPAAAGLVDLAPELTDFGETAAAVAALDLVVMVDSSVAHLAGALGRPVWVLLPKPADWRWLRDRTDSPWYPTMRLFRQPEPGAWDAPIAAAASALRTLVAARGAA
jgi:hypothetical protein